MKYLYILLLFIGFTSCTKDVEEIEELDYIQEPNDGNNPNNGQGTSSGTGQGTNPGTSSGSNPGTPSDTISIVNFLGDSIIDYWDDVSNYFPSLKCNNYGITRMGINSFLKNVDIKKLYHSICVIEIGTNDMRNVIVADTIDNYIKQYVKVLQSIKAKHIYLYSLLPRNRAKDNFDFNKHYPSVNSKIKDAVLNKMDNITYLDVYYLFIKDGAINWDYTYDGLHPNANGYKIMADELKKHIK